MLRLRGCEFKKNKNKFNLIYFIFAFAQMDFVSARTEVRIRTADLLSS
jgi:hypothetical protein